MAVDFKSLPGDQVGICIRDAAGDVHPVGPDQPIPVDSGSDSASWSVAGAAADNALASATKAAEVGKVHYVTAVAAAFSAAVAGKLLEVKDGAAVIYRTYVHNQRDLTFPKPLRGTAGNAVSVELAASGTLGQFGVVSLAGYTR